MLKVLNRIRWFAINLRYALRINKPVLFFRLTGNFLSIFMLKKAPLRYVDFAIGFKCNLNCEHCFAAALIEKDRRHIVPDEYRRIAEEAMRLGAVNFSFQGGEPLLYPELEAYIKAAKPKANLISVTTNGILLTDEMLRRLKRWSVDILTVSLDSGIPEEHDRFRGRAGSFFETYTGVKRALACGINVTIGTVVTPENLRSEGINRLIALSSFLKVILMLIPPIPIGRWKGRDDILLTKADWAYLEGLVSKYPYVRTDFEANYFKKGCGAVKEILYISPYGDVYGCPFIHKRLGNALSEPLSAIRERAAKSDLFRDYHNICVAALKEVYE